MDSGRAIGIRAESVRFSGIADRPFIVERSDLSERGYAVIGLGYVGLPVALALARQFDPVFGFDISERRIAELRAGTDRTHEVGEAALRESRLRLTAKVEDIAGASFFIVTVPTPIDAAHRPDLGPIVSACNLVGKVLRPGAVVVFESTVYPGLTREICGPLLAKASGLREGVDFKLGYSPERINPGDQVHRLETRHGSPRPPPHRRRGASGPRTGSRFAVAT